MAPLPTGYSRSPRISVPTPESTAAVLSGVGALIRGEHEHRVGDGTIGPETQRLRAALVAIQQGEAPDRHGWLRRV